MGLDPRVHLLRDKFFLRSGWIAGSSPAMTEVSAYDRNMLSNSSTKTQR
jgi:hypothetical protein